MTSPAAAAILDGMPSPRDLCRHDHGGLTWITAGPVILACYPAGDVAMRNVAVAVARQLGVPGTGVAEVMGLSENYVATLRQRALRGGAAGLVRPSRPQPQLTPADWARAGGGRPAGRRWAGGALLWAASIGCALGAATAEQFKHLTAAEAGPLAGLAALPGLRTLRPRLAAIADRADPLELQAMFASAMLAADPLLSGVYYVDDHFVPY